MGLTTKTPLKEIMRCTILVLSLAIIYATASDMAEDHIIPEESLFALDDDLSEAQQKINEMTAAGKSDKDCRKLVTETRKDVEANVNNCQKTLYALPRGQSCPAQGQDDVKSATEAKSKADKHVTHCHTQVTKAASASVNFGSRTFSSLTEGKCSSFYTSTTYTTATTTYNSAVTAHTKAKGAAAEAATGLKNAIAAAKKAKHECGCRVKADHESKFTQLSAADAANKKAWEFACKVECVLDGKTSCRCSAAPQCKKPKLTADVNAAQCAAKKSAEAKVVSAGYVNGNYAKFYMNGQKLAGPSPTGRRGLNLVVLNGQNGQDKAESFDTHGDSAAGARMLKFVQALPKGTTVLVAVKDEAKNQCGANCREALKQLGAKSYPMHYRGAYVLVGRKGGQALGEKQTTGKETSITTKL